HLLGKREIFWDLQEVAKENQSILRPGTFFDWMCQNYVITVSVGIRSFTDQDRKSRSLWRMLYEILENPGVLDRQTHVRMYVKAPGAEFGHLTFDNVVGHGHLLLSQQAVRSDLRKIEDASEIVRRFVNKRVAHRNNPGKLRRLPKFNELDAALDALDEVLCKYNLLLTAQSADSMHATRQYNWQQVLWEPWILKGSKLHPET
ncbi:MAG: hypothetical protein ACRDRQ_24435, partial [Pseudonocardiaceae bacterium]